MRRTALGFCCVILCCLSCKEKVSEPAEIKGLDYYPLTIGRFVEYQADSVVYTEIPKDTLVYRYRIKEKITEQIADNQGIKSYRLERYIKPFNPQLPYDSMNWQIKEAWLVKASDQRIQVQENNHLITKLIFPTLEKASWDGNAYNILGKETYSYEYVDQATSIGGIPLNRVLKVNQKTDTSNKILYQLRYEQYAANVGLVYREFTHLESNTTIDTVPILNRIEKGTVYTLRLLYYGTE